MDDPILWVYTGELTVTLAETPCSWAGETYRDHRLLAWAKPVLCPCLMGQGPVEEERPP